MSESLINQITLDCLLNKEIMEKHMMKQREKQIDKKDLEFYKKRIFNLFKEIISNNCREDISPDVKYAYNTFIKTTINYFKVIDNNDLLQEEYKDIIMANDESCDQSFNKLPDTLNNINEANSYLMRSVKMDVPTLDKYVKRVSNKKHDKIVLPKQRDVDIKNPELKNKGIKENGIKENGIKENGIKENITNIYEDKKENKR